MMMTIMVEDYLRAADGARSRGDRAEEARQLDAALRQADNSPQLLNRRGMLALTMGQAKEAFGFFEQAAQLDPKEPALWMNLATAARGAGNSDGERRALEQVVTLDQTHFMAQLRLAEWEERAGELAAATQRWGNVLALASGYEDLPPALTDRLAEARAFVAQRMSGFAQEMDAALQPAMEGLDPGETRRFQAGMDRLLGRRRIYHNECSGLHFPFLPADEFFDRSHFPWMAQLEAKTDAIRAELLNLLENGDDLLRPYVRLEDGTPTNKWTALDQSLDWGACFLWEYGRRNDAVCDLCPETAAILESLPRSDIDGRAPSAFFSLLRPHAHIPAHTGVTNIRTIIHLPLIVPPGCRFRVGGETRAWVEGEAFAFDDTIEHEAWNDSDALRAVLIFDVWNPHLTPLEQQLLARYYAAADQSSHRPPE
ncbi:hypothetical protein DAH51_15355 [Sphingobium yanoikuyae]|uniref:Aspartyl/asparaginy/proline hydroxylase domain-containing protein n=2 Tax=Sphingomonadaceae TaxID=41297 RepID=A0A430BT05_SPHYA|nr:hypothetical protein DAH51_15355 [Sphingobium yanoikuyae]